MEQCITADQHFNPDRAACTPAAKSLVDEVTGMLLVYEAYKGLRKRQRREIDMKTFRATVEAIVCNLMHAELTQPGVPVCVPLSKQVLGRTGRYGSKVLNKGLPHVLKIMEAPEMGFVSLDRADPARFFGRRSTIRPGTSLLRKAARRNLTVGDFTRREAGELIILKGPKEDRRKSPPKINYEDTPQIVEYRRQVAAINEFIAAADIEFDAAAAGCKAVDTGDRQLRRVFNNGTFDQGGRLYGGFWQGITKKQRAEGLSIQGDSVVALDYAQMAPRILYSLAGAMPPAGDAYEIPGLEGCRKGVKIVFNAMLYVEDIKRFPQGSRKWFPARLDIRQVVDMIQSHHSAIRHMFFGNAGFREMFIESEILLDVLLRLKDEDVVALPVHDALIVPWFAAPLVKRIMEDVFLKHTGTEGKVEEE